MNTQAATLERIGREVVDQIIELSRSASVELNSQDAKYLDESRSHLPMGSRMYVSHLPKQNWDATVAMCESVRKAGFEPIPHIPVRLLASSNELENLLSRLVKTSRTKALLLVAGDYALAAGPYLRVEEIIAGGLLERYGITHLSVAGHPEGHAKVEPAELRRVEQAKARLAAEHGLDLTFVTQFLFEAEPFLDWAYTLREDGIKAKLICGLAGPAKIVTLVRYAMRCGVGPSIRVLSTRGGALMNLVGDPGPDTMMRSLAVARLEGHANFDGVHLFGFGGLIRTLKWLEKVRQGEFQLNETGGFDVD